MADSLEPSDQNNSAAALDVEKDDSNDKGDAFDAESKLNSEDWGEHVAAFQRSREAGSGSGQFRKSTDEHLQMKRDEFWATHKESIEENRMINELAEYHEQLKLMQEIKVEEERREIEEEKERRQEMMLQQQLSQQMAFGNNMASNGQSAPSTEQQIQFLQLSLQQIDMALQQLPLQLNQQLQALHQSFQPTATQLTAQLKQEMEGNNQDRVKLLQNQQLQAQQQFSAGWASINQQFNQQGQQLKVNRLNVQNALQKLLRQHQQEQQQQQQIAVNPPEFIPSFLNPSEEEEGSPRDNNKETMQLSSGNVESADKRLMHKNRMSTINEDSNGSLRTHTPSHSQRPHIVDTVDEPPQHQRRPSKGDNDEVLSESTHSTHIPRNNLLKSRSDGSSGIGLTLRIPQMDEKICRSASRVTSQSISSQNTQKSQRSSHQSFSKSLGKSLTPPSISPMKLTHHSSSPDAHPFKAPAVNSMMGLTQSLPTTPIQTPAGRVRLQSLAEISKMSLTPEYKAQRRYSRNHKKQSHSKTRGRPHGAVGVQSLPNSPRYRSKANQNQSTSTGTGRVSPLILSGNNNKPNRPKDNGISTAYKYAGSTTTTSPVPFPDIHNINENERELSKSPSHTASIEMSQRSTSSTSISEEDENDQKSSDGMANISRQGSHRSLYSYSSMSTVFTGVHDGALLANKYLSKMDTPYNKMEVFSDIMSLWIQVFPTPLLFTFMITISICWMSHFGGNTECFAGFLLGIAIFNMIGHLLIKGMSSTLSSLCDQLYSANCKPLIGIQLQNMMGFAILVIIPLVCGTMQIVALGMEAFVTFIDSKDAIHSMHNVIHFGCGVIPPLTLFYIFSRYLQGSHVLFVHKYTAICCVVAIVFDILLLVLFQFESNYDSLIVVLVSLLSSYWMLVGAFIVVINLYKLHSETYIFQTSMEHLFAVRKWWKYLNNGFYRSALLVCDHWYFDFAIILAATQNNGMNELIAFGILCNIFHLVMDLISASEFVVKSLIFRGLSHSSIKYARDAWKYTLILGVAMTVLIGGGCFLCREWISKLFTSDHAIQSLMNKSWIYIFALMLCNAIKSGLVGGAQAMGYVHLVSSIHLCSFYVVTIPVSVWLSSLFEHEGLHPIYGSIILGNVLCIFCLLIFRFYINWSAEMEAFDLRTQREAEMMMKVVEAVHLQLKHYTERYHKGLDSLHRRTVNHQSLSLQIQRDGRDRDINGYRRRQSHCHRHSKRRQRKLEQKEPELRGRGHAANDSGMTTASNASTKSSFPIRQGTNLTNSSSESTFGILRITSLGRQKTGDTLKGPNIGSSGTLLTFDDDERGGEPRPPQMDEEEQYNYNRMRPLPHHYRMRRTFWGDLCSAIRHYCCCCLFRECGGGNGCCKEWIWYCCGCCCSESYFEEEMKAKYHSRDAYKMGYGPLLTKDGGGATMSSSYSNYHIDLNNAAKYKIIHEDHESIAAPQGGVRRQGLRHSLLRHHESNYSMDGVGAECMKSSMDQTDPHQFTMRSNE